MKIGIYARKLNTHEHMAFAHRLVELLNNGEDEVFLYYQNFDFLKVENHSIRGYFGKDDLSAGDVDFLLTLGGDGTVLDTLTIVRDTGIPVLGVNMGRFGFLASSQMEAIETTVENLHNKAYQIEERSVLSIDSNEPILGDFPFALNDFVIHKKDSSSMITVHAYLNNEFLNSYWSDGLICSTPTGSSGYSLSCGGPLLFPGSRSFVITPIAPHNLNVRPVVISEDSYLSFETEGRDESYLATMDSRSITVKSGTRLAVRKADFTFNTVQLKDETYMNTIRKKLMWGLDNRN